VVSSIRLTVICLSYLFVLVLAGTLYQVDHGIYDAQRRFFHAWILWLGPVPLPAAQPAFWLLGLNLLASLVLRLRWIRTNAGLALSHLGLILLLVGGLQTSRTSQSTMLGLVEGQESAVSLDPLRWELYLATEQQMVTVPLERLEPGASLSGPIPGLAMVVTRALPSSLPVRDARGETVGIEPRKPDRDQTADTPGLSLHLGAADSGRELVLYGGDPRPARVVAGDRSFLAWVGRKAYPLPASVRLLDFRAVFHPGTNLPRSFESTVLITDEGASRQAIISMNRPLTLRGHTLYQTSYGTDEQGRELSVLEVVHNPGRLLPYLSSLVILAGLLLHVILRRGEAA
jgi:hypothetical protein